MSYNPLTEEERHIIESKGTEYPFTGKYDNFYKEGIYICRKCNNPLFSSKAKFDAGCGWPAFDEHFSDSVKWFPDKDGHRIEIQCANCGAHLGHVFQGEKLTKKDTRHCVNSLSITFIPDGNEIPTLLGASN